MKIKEWAVFVIFLSGLWLWQRLQPDPLVEVDHAPDAPMPRWEILGPFGPGEMPPDLQAQWEDLKRTGIGPSHPDF